VKIIVLVVLRREIVTEFYGAELEAVRILLNAKLFRVLARIQVLPIIK